MNIDSESWSRLTYACHIFTTLLCSILTVLLNYNPEQISYGGYYLLERRRYVKVTVSLRWSILCDLRTSRGEEGGLILNSDQLGIPSDNASTAMCVKLKQLPYQECFCFDPQSIDKV